MNMNVIRACGIGALALLSGVSQLSEARVTRFVVEQTRSFAGGMAFGTAGAYERLDGTAYMEVSPSDPLDAIIVNLDKAPRNARGMVEFSTQFYILKPVDLAKGNHKLWYGINNRGNPTEVQIRAFPNAASTDPLSVNWTGANNILLTEGYAVVDAGWHGDGIFRPNVLYATYPVAKQPDGSPIVGPLRLEYTPAANTFTMPLITGWRPYQAADTNTAHSTLVVRDRESAPRVTIAADRWAFGTCPTGQASLTPTTTDLCLFDGFEARKLYELIYPAKDPIVMGLAYAVTRDIGSFLRYQTQDDVGNANPLALSPTAVGIRRAYSSGTSSTAMYQRDFLYLGFNEDESHRKVFDGAMIYAAGAHRLFANVQFAHPTFYSRQDINHDYTSNSIPPFTFAVTTDPITGITDGILKRPATDPLVMQMDGGIEFWHWQASLNVVDGLGRPVPVPANVRLYHLGSTSHVVEGVSVLAPPAAPGICQNSLQTTFGRATARALTVALDQWADQGIPPPNSAYPRLESGTLGTLSEYQAAFPTIPGFPPTAVQSELTVLNFGPMFNIQGGIQTLLPPALGPSYQLFQARPDRDGNDVGGIRQMELRVPLGTNTGWNVRAGFRAPDLCGLSGGYSPFAQTQAERLASGDPRLSLQERYRDHQGFVAAMKFAARDLVAERFLLQEDANLYAISAFMSNVLR
jgi:hypothetical protein